jgi:phosphoribosylanthranilate isomerase
MIRIKVCGMTRPEDALLAARLGADAIGLVFYDGSPRCVSEEAAGVIVRDLPPWVARVGVFVDAPPERVEQAVRSIGLSAVQLHGTESPAYLDALQVSVPIIKAVHMNADWEERLARYRRWPLLLDCGSREQPGGTGRSWRWEDLPAARRPVYFILAGGLHADNVLEAVKRLRPDAVDVASGVERRPGEKDPQRLAAFMRALAVHRHPGAEDD